MINNNKYMQQIEIRSYQFSMEELAISTKAVTEMAKMDADMPIYDAFIEKEIQNLAPIASIKGGIALIDDIKVDREAVLLNGQSFKVGRQIAYDLKGSNKAALFLCTAGPEVSDRSHELMQKGELLEGYLVDVLGSITVEKAIEKIHRELIVTYKKFDINCTNRYSPGYCDWSVQEQTHLFSFFPSGFCDITLSDSCLMHPIKSVSGIIGIGEQVEYHPYRCDRCRSTNCVYRKVRAEQAH